MKAGMTQFLISLVVYQHGNYKEDKILIKYLFLLEYYNAKRVC